MQLRELLLQTQKPKSATLLSLFRWMLEILELVILDEKIENNPTWDQVRQAGDAPTVTGCCRVPSRCRWY